MWTYLNKARRKFERKNEKRRRGEEARLDHLVNGYGSGNGAANLTPQFYIVCVHTLNGLKRHEGVLNDAMMATGQNLELPELHVSRILLGRYRVLRMQGSY